MADPYEKFMADVDDNIRSLGKSSSLQTLSKSWMRAVAGHNYVYNFSWLGRPIIQFPQDMVAMQELIWTVRPEVYKLLINT